MAKPLLLLLISFMSTAVEMQAATVGWPSGYSVDYLVQSLDSELPGQYHIKHYYSLKEKAYRWDIDDGANTFIFTMKDENTSGLYYYFPTTNDTAANLTNCKFVPLPFAGFKFKPTLPDLAHYRFSENITINGSPAEKLTFVDLYGKSTFMLKRSDEREGNIPIRFDAELCYENIAAEFYNYLAKEPEENVWAPPKKGECQRADTETAVYIYLFVFQNLKIEFNRIFSLNTIKRKKGLKRVDKVWESALPFPYTDEDIQLMASQLPEMFDWRNLGAVTTVKFQGACPSSWAFAVTGAMEGAYFLKHHELGVMSEQALLDCGWFQDSNGLIGGCLGGDTGAAFDWIKNHGGLPWAADYGINKEISDRCRLNHVQTHGAIKGFVHVKPDVDAVKVALYHHGPLAVSISAPVGFMYYWGGVIMSDGYRRPIDHSVLLVGYGSFYGQDYWLVKNSWSGHWGLSGYAMISRENNTLNLLDRVYYPEMI